MQEEKCLFSICSGGCFCADYITLRGVVCLKDAWNFKCVHPITFITFKTNNSFCFFSGTQNEMEDQWLSGKIFCEEWTFRHRLLTLMSFQIDNNVLKNLERYNESQNNIGPCWLPLYSQNPPILQNIFCVL